MNNPDRLFVRQYRGYNYFEIVKELYVKVHNPKQIEKYSAPFVLFAGTFLEYSLNDMLIEHAGKYFKHSIKKYCESFLSLNFNAKLICTVPIITNNKFAININSIHYQSLCDLIAQRNKIAHGKDFYFDTPTDLKDDESFSIKINVDNLADPLDISLDRCIGYKEALNTFMKEVYEAYKKDNIKKSDFIEEVVKGKFRTEIIEVDAPSIEIHYMKKKKSN